MAVTPESIALGVCDVTWNGVDLGSTKGGVEVSIQTSTHEVKADQTGDSTLKEIITGTTVEVKVPLLETDLTRLRAMMPQSAVTTPAAAPTGGTSPAGTTAVGVTGITVAGTITGTVTVGMTFKFAGHATVYRVKTWDNGTKALTFVQDAAGTGGLVAPLAASEAITWYAVSAGFEIRTGVNIDLMAGAALLKLHPTGTPASTKTYDFTVFKCSPSPNFAFKYATNEERVYEVTFKGYPDTASNNRIAAFGDFV